MKRIARPRRNDVRRASSTALMFGGLYSLYAAAFHWWLSWGPPTPSPARHLALFYAFLGAAFLCFALGGFLIWWLRPRPMVGDQRRELP